MCFRALELTSFVSKNQRGILMSTTHKINQGDSVISLSTLYELFAETIWDHSENAELKELRKNMNILMPDDILFIPDKRQKELSVPADQQHKFKRKGIPATFRMQLFDIEEPRVDQKYTLNVDGRQYEGETDTQGVLEQSIPVDSKKGVIVIGPDRYRLELDFGYLDPLNEVIGVKKRLNNMGYDCGKPNNELDENMQNQLKLFQ
ncbi:MAG: hypothetical protein ACI9LX_003724 [Paraglaciecola sp.]